MINLIVPGPDRKYFVILEDFLIGPLSSNLVSLPDETISFRTSFDSIEGSRGLYHENTVNHTKFEGDLNVQPYVSSMEFIPEQLNPAQLKLNLKNGNFWIARHGMASIGAYTNTRYYITELTENSLFIIRPTQWSSYYGTMTSIDIEISEYKRIASNSTQFQYSRVTRRKRISGSYLPKTIDEITSGQQWVDLYNISAAYPTTKSTFVWVTFAEPKYAPSVSPSSAQLRIESLCEDLKYADVAYPVETHFGDLAMKAAKKVNANQVNMIAFLKDLRRPWEMIPKLKELHKLKNVAGDFLAVKYGILPTISDLENIVAAFKRTLPYIDKNGFETYSSFTQDAVTTGDITVSVEQRIKIAIENEDSLFKDLGNRIESAGFALNLKNIWDLIPYSFVLDWFIDVGSLLERADTRLRLVKLNIQYATMSRKEIKERKLSYSSILPYSGTIKEVNYHRWTQDQSPLPPLAFTDTPSPTSHWLEGGALIAQRTKF